MASDLNYAVCRKENEWYCVAFDEEHRLDAARYLIRWLLNPELSFNEGALLVMSEQIYPKPSERTEAF